MAVPSDPTSPTPNEPDDGAGGGPGPAVIAMAVVAAIVAVVIGALVLTGGDDEAAETPTPPETEAPETSDPTTTTSTDEVPPTTDGTEIDPGDLAPTRDMPPETIAAVTADGRLVLIDTATGSVSTELAFEGDPRESDLEAGPSFIDGVAITSDGSTVWYSVCCEPAAGALFQVPADGTGEAVWMGSAINPRAGTGQHWITSGGYVARIDDLRDATVMVWQPAGATGVERVAMSPDGQVLAVTQWALSPGGLGGRLLMVSTESVVESEPSVVEIDDPAPRVVDGNLWRVPVFLRTGVLLAAGMFDDDAGWQAWAVDPDTLTVAPFAAIEYGGVPLDQDVDATGEWVLVVVGNEDETGGTIRWFGPNGQTGTVPGIFSHAAW